MGYLAVGKWKDERTRSIYYHEHAKAKPPINRTRYKKLSSSDV